MRPLYLNPWDEMSVSCRWNRSRRHARAWEERNSRGGEKKTERQTETGKKKNKKKKTADEPRGRKVSLRK